MVPLNYSDSLESRCYWLLFLVPGCFSMCITYLFKARVLGRYDISGRRLAGLKTKLEIWRSDFSLDENKIWRIIFRILIH